MYKMPKSAERWYKLWVSAFPESWHPSDLERFYMFVWVLIKNTRNPRDRYWLERNLIEDGHGLAPDDVERYCDLFEHLCSFVNVWSSQQASLITRDDMDARLKELATKTGD